MLELLKKHLQQDTSMMRHTSTSQWAPCINQQIYTNLTCLSSRRCIYDITNVSLECPIKQSILSSVDTSVMQDISHNRTWTAIVRKLILLPDSRCLKSGIHHRQTGHLYHLPLQSSMCLRPALDSYIHEVIDNI